MKIFEELFETSYSEKLPINYSKKYLLELTENRIKSICKELGPNSCFYDVIEKVMDSVDMVKGDRIFSIDFPLRNEVSCVSFADVVVSVLDYSGNSTDEVEFGLSEEHLWLIYNNNNINSLGYETEIIQRGDINLLKAANLYNIGITLLDSKEFEESLNFFQKSIEVCKTKLAEYNLAIAYACIGDLTTSYNLLKNYLKVYKDDIRALQLIIEILKEMGKDKESEKYEKRLHEIFVKMLNKYNPF